MVGQTQGQRGNADVLGPLVVLAIVTALVAVRNRQSPAAVASAEANDDGIKRVTPTDRLSGFGTSLATNSDSGERVPRGHCEQYSDPNGSARASFFRSLATRDNLETLANNALWARSITLNIAYSAATNCGVWWLQRTAPQPVTSLS